MGLRATVGALHISLEQAAVAGAAPRTTEHWAHNRQRLREAVLADDLASFLTWPVIRDTMLVAGDLHPYLASELAALQADPGWYARWASAAAEDEVGGPPPMPGLPGGSGNRLHHAYQFWTSEQAGGRPVQDHGAVVEFGAGYGAMCAVASRLGFAGDYLLFDLPEWSALQRWYLGAIGAGEGARFASSLDVLASTLVEAGPETMLVAMWSLSETPLSLRSQVLPGGEQVGSYLFGYQPAFEGIDNAAWFAQFRADRPEVDWSGGEPEPGSGNTYLVGRRR